jgi:catechol 2,3-dioxygenase
MREPIFDIAHLSHVELLTPVLEESTRFFVDSMGMFVEHRDEKSVYLRCWGDYEKYSVILTQSDHAGAAHTAFRTMSPQALERRVRAIEEAGLGLGWMDDSYGHGRSYRFRTPDGHVMELYYDTEKYRPSQELRPTLKNQHQRFTGQGAAVKHFDHINYLSSNPGRDGDFMENILGMNKTEQIRLDSGELAAVWYRCTSKSYEVVFTKDSTRAKGRLHHLSFSVDTNEGIWRAANLFVDQKVPIEFAPSKHAIQQTYFVYVMEPGGNRIEISSGGYLVFDPDHEVITWTEAERARGQAWGNKTVDSFHTYGTPVVPVDSDD